MELPCIVDRIRYRNDNGFAILVCYLDKYSKRYTKELEKELRECIDPAKGNFVVTVSNLDAQANPEGGQFIFVGDIADSKFGKQIKSTFMYQDSPSTADGMKAFLMSLPNIKETRSKAILNKFGVDGIIDILDNNPEKLREISGLTQERINLIKKSWDQKKFMRTLYEWLTKHGIQVGLGDKIFKIWGNDAIKIIEDNPYVLAELHGIGFQTADRIAHKILVDVPLIKRITSCGKYVLSEGTNSSGHLCLPYTEFKSQIKNTVIGCNFSLGKDLSEKEITSCVANVLKTNKEDFAVIKNNETADVFVYLRSIWKREVYVAQQLWKRLENNIDDLGVTVQDIDKAELSLAKFYGKRIQLDEFQKKAIGDVFQNRVSIITGGGGSGKSTICRCIVEIAQSKKLSIRLMSPTGKAAQVLSDKTGATAETIHKSLKLMPGNDSPGEPVTQNIVIVDEISMCGMDTMNALFQALEQNPNCHIIFVGDKNQLPSVSPGNFLSDLMSTGLCKIITLEKIHRQDEDSYISLLANSISKGQIVEIPSSAKDIVWHDLNTDNFKNQINEFLTQYLENKNINDIQFISPMKKMTCGVFKLNEIIQERMAEENGETIPYQRGFNKFYKKDRVIQISNNYSKDIFNGDMGVIVDFGERIPNAKENDKLQKYIDVKFGDRLVSYYDDDIDELNLAWATTVHKFQGSQSKEIAMILNREAQIMTTKEMVYTAMTRAEKMLTIFGHMSMFKLAPTKSAITIRWTNLSWFLKEAKENKSYFVVL